MNNRPPKKGKGKKFKDVIQTKVINFMEVFDFLGDFVQLRYKGRRTIHSVYGGFLSCIAASCILYFMIHKIDNFIEGNRNSIESVNVRNNIAMNDDVILLSDYGLTDKSLKVGINIKDGETFNNLANPYFVYRAYIINNMHEEKFEVKLSPCEVTDSSYYNQNFHSTGFCVNLDKFYLRGSYKTSVL